MQTVIKLKDASILGGRNAVLQSVNMEVHKGEFVYVMGKVGSGKTSLLRTLIAEQKPDEGSCEVCGFDIGTLKPSRIAALRRKVGVVFQDFQLLQDLDVRGNLEFVLRSTGWKNGKLISDRIEFALDAVGLNTKGHRMPCQLSGGEQQRVAIARAILNDPEVILADEPTGNLDEETADDIMQLLHSLNSSKGTAVVMVTHNRALVQKYPGRSFLCTGETVRENTITVE